MAIFQGDFGKGVITSSGLNEPGVNPWILYGPVASTTSVMASSTGYGSAAIPQMQFRLGTVSQGDYETEWVFCRLVVASTTDYLPGQAYSVDENFNLSLITTTVAASNKNSNVVVGYTFAPATAAGTYYMWVARAGNLAVQAAGSSTAFGQAETTATAGQLKFLASASHTSTSYTIAPLIGIGASSSITFKADSVNGSSVLQNITSQITGPFAGTGGLTDLIPGMVFTGTGAPSNSIISAIDQRGPGGSYRAFIGTNTTGAQFTAQTATATNLQTTFTVTSHVAAKVMWPTIAGAAT